MDKPAKNKAQNSAQEIIEPASPQEFLKRGWTFYGRNMYQEAAKDFLNAIASEDVDSYYALGLTQKALKKSADAIQTFQKTLSLVENLEDVVKAHMLRRLIIGQINQITSGDWNLEKEIWNKTD